MGHGLKNERRTTGINEGDLEHMNAFPAGKKLALLEKIMSRIPSASAAFTGSNHYERAILRLHKDSFLLIDLQPQEFLFTSVWHRKFRSVIGMPRLEVAMLLWVVDEELTHLRTWRI